MKIICVGRNYRAHAKELNNPVPEEPVLFMKPDSALLKKGKAFYIPSFSEDVQYEVEVVVKISRLGKNISPQFAHRYYNEIGLGIDFTARDLQNQLKSKGLPWEKAKAFDASAPLGEFVEKQKLNDINNLSFELSKNGEVVQQGNTRDMITDIDHLISYVSKYFILKMGDLIYTGTPAGVGSVAIGDHLEGFLADQKVLDVKVK